MSGLLFIKQTNVMGGGERHLLHLLAWAGGQNRPLWLATNYPALEDQARRTARLTLIESPMIPEAVAVHRLPQFLLLSHRLRSFWNQRLRTLKDQGLKWVVLDSVNHKLIVTPLAHRLGLKVIWLEHLFWSPDLTNNPLNPIDRWLIRAAEKASTIVVFSETSRQELIRLGIPNARLILWRHGVAIPPKQPPLPQPNSGVIGTIGRLHYQKGLSLLVRLLQECPDLQLEMIGDGPDRTEFLNELRDVGVLERCHIIDYAESAVTSRLPTWDVFVFPTLHDNAPIAILEAMAWARPILAHQVGGIHELLGKQGWLVSPSQPAAFLATLKRILSERSEREAKALGAYRRARQQFTLAGEQAQFDALFGGNHDQPTKNLIAQST